MGRPLPPGTAPGKGSVSTRRSHTPDRNKFCAWPADCAHPQLRCTLSSASHLWTSYSLQLVTTKTAIALSDPASSTQKRAENDRAVDGWLCPRRADDCASGMVSSPSTPRAPSGLTLDEAEVGSITNKFAPTYPQKAPRVCVYKYAPCVTKYTRSKQIRAHLDVFALLKYHNLRRGNLFHQMISSRSHTSNYNNPGPFSLTLQMPRRYHVTG